jgi:hypothetical protein
MQPFNRGRSGGRFGASPVKQRPRAIGGLAPRYAAPCRSKQSARARHRSCGSPAPSISSSGLSSPPSRCRAWIGHFPSSSAHRRATRVKTEREGERWRQTGEILRLLRARSRDRSNSDQHQPIADCGPPSDQPPLPEVRQAIHEPLSGSTLAMPRSASTVKLGSGSHTRTTGSSSSSW